MQRYSLFLTPSPDDFAYVADLIRELSASHGTTSFEPHVTVHSGNLRDLEALRRVVSAAVAGIRPFALPIRRIACGELYFRSLFIEFEENPLLRAIHEQVAGVEKGGYVLEPHLSLMYGDLPRHRRDALARGIVLDRPEIHFDQLKIMTPRNRKLGWRDTVQWQTLFRFRLGEPEPGAPARGVVFDFGGVLAEEGFREGLHALAREQGLDQERVYATALDAIYDCGYITGEGNEADFWALMRDRTGLAGEPETLSGEILKRFVLRRKVLEGVRALRRRGITTAILSDHTDWLGRLDRRDRFFGEFERVFNSYELGRGKRDPAVFDEVATLLGIPPGEILFIDDMPSNLERARGRGMATFLCTDEDELLRELERLNITGEGTCGERVS
jgi:putative hydrolase of the HAD superfamily